MRAQWYYHLGQRAGVPPLRHGPSSAPVADAILHLLPWNSRYCMNEIPLFTPARVGRASEDVALQLEAAIVGGKVAPGQSLPSERELQNVFKTGRGVIREALMMLRQKGMIEVRKGAKGGTYVKQIDVANVSESLALFLRQKQVEPRHVIDFRESMDRSIAMMAIVHASSAEKQALAEGSKALLAMALVPETDQHELGEKDRELNLLFARMSRNPVFEWVMGALQMGFSSQDYALYEDAYFREQTARNWVDTAAALAAGDLMRCSACIGRHYLLLRDCVASCAAQADVAELLDRSDAAMTGTSLTKEYPDQADPPKYERKEKECL